MPSKYKILGLSGDADIVTDENPSALVIPIESLIEENGNSYVYQIVNGTAIKTTIETGLETEFEVAVEKGLKEGDIIATSNLDQLEDGKKVATAP